MNPADIKYEPATRRVCIGREPNIYVPRCFGSADECLKIANRVQRRGNNRLDEPYMNPDYYRFVPVVPMEIDRGFAGFPVESEFILDVGRTDITGVHIGQRSLYAIVSDADYARVRCLN